MSIVLDASVVIAVWERDDEHHVAAQHLLREVLDADLVMSVLTAAEVLVGPVGAGQVDSALADLLALGVRVLPLTSDDMVSLAAVRAETGLRMPDACVLHLASRTGASLATFDARLGAAAVARGIVVVG